MPVRVWPYVQKKKKISNRVPETTTTQAVPSFSYARTCVAVRGWPYMQKIKNNKKNFQTTCQKQQPHRPFLCSRVPVRAWPYVRGCTWKKTNKKKTFKPRARNNNHTGRSFALVNDDWIGPLCLSINAHKKSRNS